MARTEQRRRTFQTGISGNVHENVGRKKEDVPKYESKKI
jgi:hypothetical protein